MTRFLQCFVQMTPPKKLNLLGDPQPAMRAQVKIVGYFNISKGLITRAGVTHPGWQKLVGIQKKGRINESKGRNARGKSLEFS